MTWPDMWLVDSYWTDHIDWSDAIADTAWTLYTVVVICYDGGTKPVVMIVEAQSA